MAIVKGVVVSARKELLVQTAHGVRKRHPLIPHVKTGDDVWVHLTDMGELLKVEALSYEHSVEEPPHIEKVLESPVDYSELDSVE